MKFNFNENVSKMLDFLNFPRIIFSKEELETTKDEQLQKVIKDDYLGFLEKTSHQLLPFRKDIEKFFQKDTYSSYDFVRILIRAYPVFDFQTIDDYFTFIREQNEADYKNKIINALLTIEDDDLSQEVNDSNAIAYINQLKIDSSNKWSLLLMLQSSMDYFEEYVRLLNKVRIYYEEYYQMYREKLIEVGNEVSKRLSKNTKNAFNELTYNAVDYDFSDFDDCDFYVSFVFPYTLSFLDYSEKDIRVIWGMEMAYSFEKINQINEDKFSQRIKIFKNLGDKTRYNTLKLIVEGYSAIKDIAKALDVSSATISYHVNEFVTSGIIGLSKERNKKSGYVVDYHKLNEIIEDFKIDLKFPEIKKKS